MHDSRIGSKGPVKVIVLDGQTESVGEIQGEFEEIVRLVLQRPVPAGSAVAIERGSITAMGEVRGCEPLGNQFAVYLKIDHVVPETAMSSFLNKTNASPGVPAGDSAAVRLESELGRIPSLFARLMHVGLLRLDCPVTETGYLERRHAQLFMDWLSSQLADQKADLDQYFSSLQGHRRSLVHLWLTFPPYEVAVPRDARQADRDLFRAELETLGAMFRAELTASAAADAAAVRPELAWQ